MLVYQFLVTVEEEEYSVECSPGNHIRIPGNPDIEPASVTATMWVYFNDVAIPRQDFFSKNDDYALSLHEWANDGTIYPINTLISHGFSKAGKAAFHFPDHFPVCGIGE